jgi:hypothetical protein
MADFGALEFALTERFVLNTSTQVIDTGALEYALTERLVVLGAAAPTGQPTMRRWGGVPYMPHIDHASQRRWG